jgi:hypothetical protein
VAVALVVCVAAVGARRWRTVAAADQQRQAPERAQDLSAGAPARGLSKQSRAARCVRRRKPVERVREVLSPIGGALEWPGRAEIASRPAASHSSRSGGARMEPAAREEPHEPSRVGPSIRWLPPPVRAEPLKRKEGRPRRRIVGAETGWRRRRGPAPTRERRPRLNFVNFSDHHHRRPLFTARARALCSSKSRFGC